MLSKMYSNFKVRGVLNTISFKHTNTISSCTVEYTAL